MHSTETMDAPQLPQSWMAASLAFAFLVGLALSIPLINGVGVTPTGYEQAITLDRAQPAQHHAESVIEKNIPGQCLYCAVSQDRTPAETLPSDVGPFAVSRLEEVEV